MAKATVVYKEVERPVEKVILELTPEEVEFIRYWAVPSAARATISAAWRLAKLLPKTGAGYSPDKCFLEE